MIIVVDYGMGNSGSILNMLSRIGVEAELSRDPGRILAGEKLVLPGVGAFDEGLERLEALGLIGPLTRAVVDEGRPILGICLGMQLFADGSEEGRRQGLGWIPGRAVRFRSAGRDGPLRVPHMGWNRVRVRKQSPLLDGLDADARFYFVHSYHVECRNPEDVLGTTEYGVEFVSAVARAGVVGVQFHPEKSLRWGIELFRRFVARG